MEILIFLAQKQVNNRKLKIFVQKPEG
jgi:hypothetical protein